MAYSQKWLVQPPDVPSSSDEMTPQHQQFASYLRSLALEGTITALLANWLWEYEQRFTPEEKRVLQKAPAAEELPKEEPPKNGGTLPDSIAQGVANVLKEVSSTLKELNAGIKSLGSAFNEGLQRMDTSYANAQDKMNDGVDKLTAGFERLAGGYSSLVDDHRSLLGIVYPHNERMYATVNDSMVAYRQGLVAQADAAKRVSESEAGSSIDAEAGRAVVGLFTKAAEKRLLGSMSEDEPKKAPEAPKAPEPKKEAKPAPNPETPKKEGMDYP